MNLTNAEVRRTEKVTPSTFTIQNERNCISRYFE